MENEKATNMGDGELDGCLTSGFPEAIVRASRTAPRPANLQEKRSFAKTGLRIEF